MSWTTIRDGMKTRLATISGLTTFDVMPDTLPNKDNAVVLPGDPLIEIGAHGSKKLINLIVRLRCARATSKETAAALDTYVDGIEAAVNGDRTLGGAVDVCFLTGVQSYGNPDPLVKQLETDVIFRAYGTA